MQVLVDHLEKNIYGQSQNIRLLTIALLSGGHVLLEGVPGLGKTKMVRTLAQLVDGQYRRIQFTPDMMPSDLTGNIIYNMQANQFQTVKGPVFTHLLLADEINRTPPKTQSALLESMEEGQVTIQGETYALPDPYFVVATQNPVEYEGTYPLPEAQLDRFLFKLIVDYPPQEQEEEILHHHVPDTKGEGIQVEPVLSVQELVEHRKKLKDITVEDSIVSYITSCVRSTRTSPKVQLGASPRAGLAILMAAKAHALLEQRDYVTPDDVKMVLQPAPRHRLILHPQVELEGGTSDGVIQEIMATVPVPR